MEVVHIPTGAVFRAHPYSHPGDMLRSVKVYWNESGAQPEGPGDYAQEVQRVASQLLLERAVKDRRSGMRLENTDFGESYESDESVMITGALPGFEITDEMRAVAEHSFEQAKLALNNYMRAAQKAVSALGTQFETNPRGALDIASQAMGIAENNVLFALELAHRIIRANDIQGAFQMQDLFVQSQMNLGDTINNTATHAFESPRARSKPANMIAKPIIDLDR